MHRTGARIHAFIALIPAMLALGACTSTRETSPQRSATEQLLISTAVDRAVEGMDLKIPQGTKVFLDAGQLEGSDGKKHNLSDYAGKNVILWFYPKDDTPG